MAVQSLFTILDVLTSWLSKERARATRAKLREREREKEEHVRREGARRAAKEGIKEGSKETSNEEIEGITVRNITYQYTVCCDRKED
jgi:Mg-chelatase subunit ChlD